MAVTGLVLFGFVVGHLAGNLLIFVGRDAINDYAEWLKSMPTVVWTTRIVLLASLLTHVFIATRLKLANSAARPQDYAFKATVQAGLASRAMMGTGVLVLAYVVYHLLHFTLGVTDPEAFALEETVDGETRQDVYGMVLAGFQNSIVVVLVYIVANGLLALHLSHGVASLFQSLGIHDDRYTPMIQKSGIGLAVLIGAGFISIPVAIRLGLVQ